MKPAFPLYIPSKGRYENMLTHKALCQQQVCHYIVAEPQEVKQYKAAVNSAFCQVIELDMTYKEKYELCDNHGLSKSTGSGPARNFIWEHSISQGHAYHWIMDDNIRDFYRVHRNYKHRVFDGVFWCIMEDFAQRYTNLAMCGPQYEMFIERRSKRNPITFNTRIYSCNLIRNDVPFRWRGRYNEDTIMSLDMLKAGWCTVQFNALLQAKLGTQKMKGGNTDELYQGEKVEGSIYAKGGTDEKSEMLVRVHPDCSKVTWRFGRVHHLVDYKPFRKNKLKKKPGANPQGVNNFGMKLVKT